MNRIVCQFVDCKFYTYIVYQHTRRKQFGVSDLKVIGRDFVVLIHSLAENDQRISDEQMGDMVRQELIYAVVYQALLDVFIERHVVVVVFWPI